MRYLKQHVTLGRAFPDGRVEITREFGEDIEALAESFSTPTDLTAVLAAIAVLQSGLASLTTTVAALTSRVVELEKGGYQS